MKNLSKHHPILNDNSMSSYLGAVSKLFVEVYKLTGGEPLQAN